MESSNFFEFLFAWPGCLLWVLVIAGLAVGGGGGGSGAGKDPFDSSGSGSSSGSLFDDYD